MKAKSVFWGVSLSISSIVPVIMTLALLGCTKAEESSSVSIRFPGPPAEARSGVLQSVSPFAVASTTWDSVDPTSLTELGCFAVFVGGPEQELRGSFCQNKSGAEVIRFGKAAGLFGKGQEVTIEIQSGKAREISIVGMKLVNGSCEGSLSGLTMSNYSNPFLIGKATVDLVPGSQEVSIAAIESFNNDNKLGHCSFLPDSGGGDGGGGSTTPIRLTVEPLYDNGVNWNDYVKNLGSSSYSAAACTGSETGGAKSCIHGGEKRKVAVTGSSSCADLSANDNGDVFKWTCEVIGGVATFVSSGFQEKKGLGDLLDPSAFRSKYITVKKGSSVIGESLPSVWWSNTVKPVTANTASASSALGLSQSAGEINTIFTVGTTAGVAIASSGYNLQSDKIGLVVLPGSKLQYNGATQSSCSLSTGNVLSSGGSRCLVASGSRKFVWVEGDFDGSSSPKSDFGVFLYNACFSRLHRVTADNQAMDGVRLQSSSSNTGTVVVARKNTLAGLYLADSSDNQFTSVLAYSNSTNGVRLEDVSPAPTTSSHRNSFIKVVSANNGTNGFSIHRGDFNLVNALKAYNNGAKGADIGGNSQVLTQVLVFGNNGSGINLWGSRSNASFVTSANNKGTGIALTSNSSPMGYFSLNQFLSVSNGYFDGTYDYFGLHLLQHGSSHVSQGVVSKGSDDINSIRLQDVTSIKFTGVMMLEGVCNLTGSNSAPGLSASCAATDSSSFTKISASASASALVGKITSDSSNLSGGATGIAAFNDLMDWFYFQSPLRGWGSTGAPSTDTAARGRCVTGNCQIWDFRIKSADSLTLNKSGNGSTANGAFAAGAACPASIGGDRYRDDMLQLSYADGLIAVNNASTGAACVSGDTTCFNRYLLNASEIMGDGLGDDDGLCESNEACVYAPNFGAYQGDGDLVGPCTFQDSSTIGVKGVKMYAYPSNGI